MLLPQTRPTRIKVQRQGKHNENRRNVSDVDVSITKPAFFQPCGVVSYLQQLWIKILMSLKREYVRRVTALKRYLIVRKHLYNIVIIFTKSSHLYHLSVYSDIFILINSYQKMLGIIETHVNKIIRHIEAIKLKINL